MNEHKFLEDVEKIKRKYEEKIKSRKNLFEKEKKKIINNYKIISEKEFINNKHKIEELDKDYEEKIKNLK